ncbi:hypothetical protein [Paenibacillus brasilensis]|uniref:Endoglucanase B carbohydrate binding domain-containing protein n=1 Tax=Paenibacillus brasilensis TaxID=128574 RepID=A0ABU0KUN7_9BACL|nr:hypothetical protein [Paenibacillus brasilensis]
MNKAKRDYASLYHSNRLPGQPACYDGGCLSNSGNAGPQDWTPYKEFGNTFAPAYDSNGIKLLPEFFNSVKDAEVTLRFHFWSGDVVTYKITKSGTRVTGTAS